MQETPGITREQRVLEEKMRRNGALRAERTLQNALNKGQVGRTKYGMGLVKRLLGGLTEELEKRVKVRTGPMNPDRQAQLELLDGLGCGRVAMISLQTLVQSVAGGRAGKIPTVQTVVHAIGKALEDEERLDRAAKEDYGGFVEVRNRLRKARPTVRDRWVREFLSHTKEGPVVPKWPRKHLVGLGQLIFQMIRELVPDLLHVYPDATARKVRGKSLPLRVRLSDTALEWFTDAAQRQGDLFPDWKPCLQVPAEWAHSRDGGYYLHDNKRCLIIRGEAVEDWVSDESCPDVLNAVNALQAVPFEGNPAVAKVYAHSFEHDMAMGGTAIREMLPLPAKPVDKNGNPPPDGHEDWKEYRAKAHAVYKGNAEKYSHLIRNSRIYHTLGEFKNKRFYFPQRLDWRGRCYPVPPYLQPQGCDLAKGLLRFAEGKPIETEAQADWLRIHLANTWGNDKVPFSERIEWVAQHEKDIRAVGRDPLDCRWWEEADEPWQFLAACDEYARFLDDGFGTPAHVVVGMDGSCNGLQVYSLLSRHVGEGRATNCLPADRPQDIYQDVADMALQLLRGRHPEKDEQAAKDWLRILDGKIPRSLTKRPVMTTPYGVTLHSIEKYISEWRWENTWGKDGFPYFAPKHTWFMARLIEQAISQVVFGAFETMDWLRSLANICTDNGVEARWLTPLGFPVMQRYYKTEKYTVKTHFRGRFTKWHYLKEVDSLEVKRRKQADALPPNFVHSLDAAAMMLTVKYARAAGVKNLCMVHDSYGTTAAEAPVLAAELREAWVDLFMDDPLLDLGKQVRALCGEGVAIPEMPPKGDLDIQELKKSLYLFA